MNKTTSACGAALLALVVVGSAASQAVRAQDLTGDKRVTLVSASGERLEIGRVRFEPAGADRWRFGFVLAAEGFTERFLAMRPFRCVASATHQLCHFPYGSEDTVSRHDLMPLEYALMFIATKPGALHISGRDGLFYKLAFTDRGLRGELHDVDMDPIITPREGGSRRPITYRQLERADPKSHWMPALLIE
ncbi:hypothetical protein [Methylibium sp.]|uniref:hypothetical protein n=1 Tax=Methylibium sp. TaxID=2067992 RepID=UPI003D1494BD